jgi:hypothetical protein
LAPERCTTLRHFSFSVRMSAVNCSGVEGDGSAQIAANLSRSVADASALLISALSRATTVFGTPAGATMPFQVLASYPGTPASAIVGTSGRASERFVLLTPSARTRPAFA